MVGSTGGVGGCKIPSKNFPAKPCSIFFLVTTKWSHYQIHRWSQLLACCSTSEPSIVYIRKLGSSIDLYSYSGTDPLGMFPLFLKRTAEWLMFWLPVSVWCFDGFFVWVVSLLAGDRPNVTPIPKGLSSSSVANYQPISITPVLSTVFERLVAVHLG